jgi:hypothetical protein
VKSVAQAGILDLDSEILICIDRAFSKFGQSVATVVYWKFQLETKLKKEDLVERPDLFCNAIRDIFKDGSKTIEAAITEELKKQFRLPNRNYKELGDILASIRVRG